MQPHRRQPTRLPRPWDSPGKNTGVGCHFLLQCMKVKSESEVTQSCPIQRRHGLQPTRLLCPWDFPGKSTGVGCHCLFQVLSYSPPNFDWTKLTHHYPPQTSTSLFSISIKQHPCLPRPFFPPHTLISNQFRNPSVLFSHCLSWSLVLLIRCCVRNNPKC